MKNLPSVKGIIMTLLVITLLEFMGSSLERFTIMKSDSSLTSMGMNLIESVLIKAENERNGEESSLAFTTSSFKQEISVASLKAESPVVIYDGMTLSELAAKLDRSLKNELAGKGYVYANASITWGVDPYMAVAISLLETGCNGKCSNLVRQCNNVGGMVGSGCDGWAKFDTIDEGIEAMIRNLGKYYVAQGLTTVEQIGHKYAASSTWATKVRNYMNQIQNA